MDLPQIQAFCLSLPAVTEDIKWENHLCFSVGGKMFCVTSTEGTLTYSFKATDEEFEELGARKGMMPAPYMARNKWILVSDPAVLKKGETERLLRQSYDLVKAKLTKKLRTELGIA
jgi:predicted DNA-binding protein (MmcQ/YjbR family)